jgi:putative oxidoreductase
MTRVQTLLGSSQLTDYGLLFIRIGIGVMFLWHGYPKIAGGPDGWKELGESMKYLGINFFPLLWGFLGAMSEFLGALLLIAGFRFRLACFMLAATMFVAAVSHLGAGDGMFGHPMLLKMRLFSQDLCLLVRVKSVWTDDLWVEVVYRCVKETSATLCELICLNSSYNVKLDQLPVFSF